MPAPAQPPLTPIDPAALQQRIARLPTLPSLAQELLHIQVDDDTAIERLAQSISTDQTLAARALRIANSPFYGMRRKIGSIQEAIVVLGYRAVRAMIVSAAAVNTLRTLRTATSFRPRPFWRHSIGTAVAARQLAMHLPCNPDVAFTAGLLHDIGQIVLAITCPEHYAQVLAAAQQTPAPLDLHEGAIIGLSHSEAGALLAGHWQLPEAISAAIAHHHSPDEHQHDSLVALIHVANVLAHSLELSGDPSERVPPLDEPSWIRMRLDDRTLRTLLTQISQTFDDTLRALNP